MPNKISTEDLMKPRYKVIADYPGSPFDVNEIIIDNGARPDDKSYPTYLDRYPNIFKAMEWWEHRKIEDMPEYIYIPPKGYPHPLKDFRVDNIGYAEYLHGETGEWECISN